jgi:hypothetical protein
MFAVRPDALQVAWLGTTSRRAAGGCYWYLGTRAGSQAVPFKVAKLPGVAFYSVQIANRSPAVFSRAQLRANGWRAVVTIPDSAS